jgi:transcriptional regulator with GAF, ATPase, and Fis domain
MNPGTASDRVSEGRSGLAISAIRSGVEPADHRVTATGAVELSNELFRMISDVLDVRDVFPRIAQTASRLLQHDCLDLVVHDPFGNPLLRTQSAKEFPEHQPGLVAGRSEFCVVRDLQEVASQDAGWAPRPFVEGLAAAGYQSFLCIRARARERVIRLGFFSRQREAYALDDVPVARLIAACIAVVVAHDELAEAQRTRVDACVHADRLDSRIRTLTEASEWQPGALPVVGHSPGWRQVLQKAAQVASTNTTVFVQGESGTGKEVVARFIHRASPRKTGPFVAINCAALPEQLLESELFGYERGAFTGAHQAKAGQIELASTGVLFLDEVSEMSPPAQAKLLRVLQEREFQRLGGTRPIKANVRVIAASNRDLQRAVAEGSFREDLFYRLQVFDIRIPPLRERRGDIPLLTDAFLQEFNRSTGCSFAGLSPEAREMLLSHEWPGNVRELHNVLERAAILCQGGLITGEHLSLGSPSVLTSRRPSSLSDVERRTIEQILRETDGNKSKAARRLGITRTQLYGRLRKYELEPA